MPQSGMPPRQLLTGPEITVLARLYLDAYHAVARIRAEDPVGAHIHQVKIPEALTESLAALALPHLLGRVRAVTPGGRRADLLISCRRSAEELVAVKGTGLNGWVTITQSDVRADRMVWVSFAAHLLDRRAAVEVVLLPAGLFRALTPGRTRLDQLAAARAGVRVRLDPGRPATPLPAEPGGSEAAA
jgi:hypothetical protein